MAASVCAFFLDGGNLHERILRHSEILFLH